MNNVIKLRFKRLYSSDCNWGDLEFLRNLRSSNSVNEFLFHTKKITRIEQEQWFYSEYSVDPNYMIWICYDEEKHIKIGYVQFKIISLIHRTVECIWVIDHDYANLHLDELFIKWIIQNVQSWDDNIHRIEVKLLINDKVRLNSLINCGFELDGIIRECVFKNNIFCDIYVLSYLL